MDSSDTQSSPSASPSTGMAPSRTPRPEPEGAPLSAAASMDVATSSAQPLGRPSLLGQATEASHFRAIVENSDDAIISKTLDGRITSWNRGAEQVFGYRAEEMLGKPMLLLFPADRVDEERFILERLLLGEKVDHFETVRLRKDGRPVHVSVTISPIRDGTGRVIGASKIARDISERIRLERAARQYEAIVESTEDAVISKAIDGTITSWNPAAQTIFGYSAEEMIGRPIHVLLPPDRMAEEDLILERLRQGERVEHFETVRLRKDGTPIDVSVTISPIRDQHRWVVGASKIVRDISRRKHAEARLQLASSVFTHTTEAVAIADRKGRLIEVNQAFTRITGYARQDVLGRGYRFFKSGRQNPDVMDTLIRQLQSQGHCQGEVWSRRKDGAPYAGLLTISAVCDAQGAVQSYVALFADITALRLQQERLEHVAHYDALTDMPNRLLLYDRLHQAMAACQRNQQSLAVLYMDLDGFKGINDRFGHAVGDLLLVTVSARMKAALREVDTLARLGGDEFVVVLVDVSSPQEWQPLVERVLKACHEPVWLEGHAVCVSASVGVTLYPQDDVDVATLIGQADSAMYEAKQSGKNRYALFGRGPDAG